MFYDAVKNDHGLRYDPFKALVVPRPIGWVSTLSTQGIVNLAPYSFFNAVSTKPHYVMFASAGRKDSLRNAEETGEFVCSLATYDLREQMGVTALSVAPDVDEMAMAGLTPAPSHFVKVPRVKESPVAFECKYFKTVEIPDDNYIVIGQVVGIYIDDTVISNGLIDIMKIKPIARLGYKDYTLVDNMFQLEG